MIDQLIGNKFRHIYYPATEFLMDTIYNDNVDLSKIELNMYDLEPCKAFIDEEAMYFNKVLLELIFAYRSGLDGKYDMIYLREELDCGIARVAVGDAIFDKYHSRLTDAILDRLVVTFDKIVGVKTSDTPVLIGWTNIDGGYDAGIIFI